MTDDRGIPVLAAPRGVRKQRGVGRALLSTTEGRRRGGLRADQPGAGPHVRLLCAALEGTQRGRQLPLHQGLSQNSSCTTTGMVRRAKSRSYREEVSNPFEPSCELAPIQSSDLRQIRTGGRVIDRLKLR
jgi:hypothetical protein